MNFKYCPECKGKIKKVDVNYNGQGTYFCEKCKNRFIIDSEY